MARAGWRSPPQSLKQAKPSCPNGRRGLADLEAELFVFPGSRHDDQCDSVSQALLDKNNSFMTWLSLEDWEVLLAKARTPVRKRRGSLFG